MSGPSRTRLDQILRLSKQIFKTTYNPSQVRTGAKVLRQPLKGETVREYYKPSGIDLKLLRKIDPEPNHYDEKEERRLERIANRKRKGKGKPAKAKEANTGGKGKKKK